MKTNWIALNGEINWVSGELELLPPQKSGESSDMANNQSWVSARCADVFKEGEIHFQVHRPGSNNVFRVSFGHTSGDNRIDIGIGSQKGGASYVFAIQKRGGEWETIASSGWNQKTLFNQWVDLKIKIFGSKVTMLVNGVEVINSHSPVPIQSGQVTVVAQGPGTTKIKDWSLASKQQTAFIVMQFSESYNELYEEIIREVCEKEFKYSCFRADEIYSQRLIIQDIEDSINRSSLVVADITPNNPNVFYEVGYAHAIKKPTILLCDKARDDKLPFDVSGFRTLFYDNTIKGKGVMQNGLRKHLHYISNSN